VEANQPNLSFDAPAYPNKDSPLHAVFTTDQESADERVERTQMQASVNSCLNILDEREHQILRDYFGLEDGSPMTLREIGDALGITRERIRQLRNRALKKIYFKYGEQLADFF
jgi:RNA polymerase primary sigma factor